MFQTIIAPVNTILQWITATVTGLPVDFYTTTFPLTENPISEKSVWLRGKTEGIDWSDMRTTTNKAFGTQDGNQSGTTFNDSVAILKGKFGPDQEAFSTIFNNTSAIAAYMEVEHHLRGTLIGHSIQTYECLVSVNSSAQTQGSYAEIVKWNGALNSFISLTGQVAITAPSTGAVFHSKIVGNTITCYINGTQIASVTDSVGLSGSAPYTTGNPGIGHWLHNNGATGDPTQYGFSDFTAQTITSYRDTATRFRLAAQAFRDTATRFRLAGQSWRDTATRFRLASAATWRNTSTRFRLQSATIWRDTATRFRLASAATLRDTAVRFRLQAQAFRDTTTRFRLRAQAFRDTAVRFNLNVPGQNVRDTATRLRLRSAAVWRDTAVRYLLQSATQWRDTVARFRLSALAYRDTATRFRLRSALVWRDTAARFRLSGTSIRDTSVRFNLVQIGGAIRDTALRFRLVSQGTLRDTAVRFRLGLLGVRDTRTRFSLRAGATRDSIIRFRLSTPGGPVLVAAHAVSDSAKFSHTVNDRSAGS